jgi:dolichol-phosphate mannosyltransferase
MRGEPDPQQLYRNRFGHFRESRSAIWDVLVHGFFRAWVRRSDTVVDLGCGYGEFLNHISAARRIGVDLNPDSADMLELGVEFHEGRADDLGFLPDDSVDVVFTSNLLEHLQSKAEVERTIAEARRVLKPGGHFIAMGPNIRFVAGANCQGKDVIPRLPQLPRSQMQTGQVEGIGLGGVRGKRLALQWASKRAW